MFQNNPGGLTNEILMKETPGTCLLTPQEVEQVYRERFGRGERAADLSELPPPVGICDNRVLLLPITKAEVEGALKGMKKNTATGPENIAVKKIRKNRDANIETLMIFFNSCLSGGIFAEKLMQNRSILLPKSGNLQEIGNWRPLTISSVVLRFYTKVMAARMLAAVPLNPQQRGFIKAAGCAKNVTLLAEILHDARENKQEVVVAFLDLAKAFDTIGHAHIVQALERCRVSNHVIQIVTNLY